MILAEPICPRYSKGISSAKHVRWGSEKGVGPTDGLVYGTGRRRGTRNAELVGVAWAAKILKVFFRIGALAKLEVSVRCWKFRYVKVHVFTRFSDAMTVAKNVKTTIDNVPRKRNPASGDITELKGQSTVFFKFKFPDLRN